MSDLVKLLILFSVLHAVFFAIAVVVEYKNSKKFLNFIAYLQNGIAGEGVKYAAWRGITVSKHHNVFVDSVLYYPSLESVLEKLPAVHAKMTADGYVWDGLSGPESKSTYIRRRRDCDKIVKKLLVELDDAFYIELKDQGNVEESGIALGRCDYTRDDGVGHERWFVNCDDGNIYHFEGYPHPKYLTPSDMSKKELAGASYLR